MYSQMNIEVSRRAVLEGIESSNDFVVNNTSHCVYHIIFSHVVENISHRREILFTENKNILEGVNPRRIYQSILE